MEFARLLQERLMIDCDLLIDGPTPTRLADAFRLDAALLDRQRPAVLIAGHADNPIEQMQRGFETACIVLEEAGCPAPHQLTTARFYYRLDYQERQNAPHSS